MRAKAPEKAKRPRLLLYLALAALATSLAASGTLAKYASSFGYQVGTQVAAFAGGKSVDFAVPVDEMVPGSRQTVTFAVRNYEDDTNCQVRMTYEIQAETTGNLPLVFEGLVGTKTDSMTLSTVAGQVTRSGNTLTATGGGLPVAEGDGATGGKVTHSYQLTLYWPETEKAEDYSQEIDMVTVTVTATQVDPGAAE